MFVSRRDFLLMAGMAAIYTGVLGGPALGDSVKPKLNVDLKKVAISGYDTVAYFTDGKPVRGNAEIESVWQGARWRFATTEHRDMFVKRPEAYAPRFGGFCAMAMAQGATVRADPQAWAIIDGKLYLNGDNAGREEFQKDMAINIRNAEENWKVAGH